MPWTVGEWVESGSVAICETGVHACEPPDVAYWLAASLWEVELGGEIVRSHHKVAASRGRLVRRIDAYGTVVRDLAEVGAWRSRDRAVAALHNDGDRALGDRLSAATTLDALVALDSDVSDASFALTAAALAVDAAHDALYGNPAESPFVACCSAGHVVAGPAGDRDAYDEGYAAERAFQSRWLTVRLELT